MSRFRCLQDFATAEVDALVECGNPNCRRRVVAHPRALLGKIRKERWLHYLNIQSRHMVCGLCGHKGARIAPVPRIVGPLDCDEFRADIEAMWERVMAEAEAEKLTNWKFTGPDEDGYLWIDLKGDTERSINLGPIDPALDKVADLLAENDYEERGAERLNR